MVPVISSEDSNNITMMKWGLIPYWSKNEKIGYNLINVRSENLFDKKTLSNLIEVHRCLIPASGFFEWRLENNEKNVYYFYLKDNDIFAMAGLYSYWNPPGSRDKITSFAILTTQSNDLVANIHNRMPVILEKKDIESWLDLSTPMSHIKSLLLPYRSELMAYHRVSNAVNDPKNNNPSLLEEYTGPYAAIDEFF